MNFPTRANLTAVRMLRIWLLVFLAVLLPIRGAVAAAMLCPPPGAEQTVQVHAHQDHDSHQAHGAVHQYSAVVDAGAGHSDTGHHDHEAADKCNLCASYCSLTGLLGHSPSVPDQHSPATKFPGLNALVPSFYSGGQERPPRTI